MTIHRKRRVAVSTLMLVLIVPALALAHAVVYPRASTRGAYERYVLRVPNEKNVATTKVEIHFPAGLRVTAFADVAGWQLEPMTDSAGAITGAVWTGSLPPKRFVEFPFVAANPKTDARLVWPTYQTYADGERVAWEGPEGSKTPASATEIKAAGPPPGVNGSLTAMLVAGAALLLALISLGLALRKPQR